MLDQVALEHKYNRKALINVVKDEYASAIERHSDPDETSDILYMLMHKSIQPIQNAVSLLRTRGYTWEEAVQVIDRRSEDENPLFSIVVNRTGSLTINSKYRPTVAVIEAKRYMGNLPPLLEHPIPWTNHYDGGYITQRHTAILGSTNQHDKWINLAPLNKLQDIAWRMNQTVLEYYNSEHIYDHQQAETVYADLWGKAFYFMWNMDARGRMYSKGYEVNLQSTEFHKALLDFNTGEYLNDQGVDNLLMAIASTNGGSKMTWNNRLKLGKELLQSKVSLEDTQYDINTTDIKEPILFTKYVQSYIDNADVDMKCHTPVGLDATASGNQIMAVLTGCKATAKAVNLINTGKREDVYAHLAEDMNKTLSADEQVCKDMVKQPFMTHWYSSVAGPRNAFTPNQLKAFYSALEGKFTGPERFMAIVTKLWKDRDTFVFTTPDGHHAVIKTHVLQTAVITLEEDVEFSYDYAVHMPTGSHLHLCANIIHMYDAWVAREMVMRCDFEVATIHDSFWCLPNHMMEMAAMYREILAELAESKHLLKTLEQLAGHPVEFKMESEDLADDIRQSQYALA